MSLNIRQNWKTASAGFTLIGGAVIHLIFQVRAGNATEESWTIALGAVIGGIGLLVAADGNKVVSKEDAKATYLTSADAETTFIKKTDITPKV